MELSKVPKLEGWLTFAEAGQRLGVTRQAVFGMVARDELTEVRSVGGPKPIHLVAESDVLKLAEKREQARKKREERRAAARKAA